jgi:hypothetical protein
MNTRNYIDQLVSEHKPAKKLFSFRTTHLVWTLLTLSIVIGTILSIHIRPDISAKLSSLPFLWEMALFLTAIISGSYSALKLSTPGRHSTPLKWAPFGIALLAIVSLVIHFAMSPHNSFAIPFNIHAYCLSIGAIVGLVPTVALFYLIKKNAPTQLALTAAIATLSGICAGTLTIFLICHIENLTHVLIAHCSLLLVLPTVAILISRKILKW